MDQRREKLLMAELKAIEHWEDGYRKVKIHNNMDISAHNTRLDRRKEILREILDLRRQNGIFR